MSNCFYHRISLLGICFFYLIPFSWCQGYRYTHGVSAQKEFATHFFRWQGSRGNVPERSKALDSLAFIRCVYFTGLLAEKSEWSLYDLLDSIPAGKAAHQRFFGKPTFFSEPLDISYRAVVGQSFALKGGVKAEIMQQATLKVDTSDLLSVNNKVLEESIHKKFRNSFGQGYHLNEYMRSVAHRSVMEKYGEGVFGIYTLFMHRPVIARERTMLEVLAYNVTLFGVYMD